MKRIIIFIALLNLAFATKAQNEKEVTLDEVKVEAARIVNTATGQQIFPTDKQKEHSTNGYSLLNKLTLPSILVNEVTHTITAKGNLGSVQVRINDIIATTQDILSLEMKAVKYVEYIRNPGVRYGEDVAFVINIVTRRAISGYVVGTDLTQTLTNQRSYYEVYGRWNRGKSEVDIDYGFYQHNFKGARSETDTQYILQNGSTYDKCTKDISNVEKSLDNNLTLRYNLADSNLYVMQVTLSGNIDNYPSNKTKRELTANNIKSLSSLYNHDRATTPALDLYYHTLLGKHQNITANIVSTYINGKYVYNLDEMGKNYAYQALGDSYSLTGEAIYENTLKPFTFSSGLQFMQKYMNNDYSGDVETTTSDHTSNLYLFSQIKGKLAPLRYVLGLGLSRQYYSQASDNYTYWLVRPKFTLSMPFLKTFNVKYDMTVSQQPPRTAYLSNVSIRTDEMDINEGNPKLRPAKRIEQDLTLSYQTPHLYSHIDAYYRINLHPSMQEIYRKDNVFVFTRTNQPKINMLYITNNTRYDIIPDKLTATFDGGLLRCFNYGNTYKHHYSAFNFSVDMQAYLGKFTLQAHADNGWRFLEGENKGHQGAAYYCSAAYHIGNVDITLFMQHIFQHNPMQEKSELLNRYVHRIYSSYSTDLGNMISLNIVWKLSHGRKYTDIQRSMNNKDKDTGILK